MLLMQQSRLTQEKESLVGQQRSQKLLLALEQVSTTSTALREIQLYYHNQVCVCVCVCVHYRWGMYVCHHWVKLSHGIFLSLRELPSERFGLSLQMSR